MKRTDVRLLMLGVMLCFGLLGASCIEPNKGPRDFPSLQAPPIAPPEVQLIRPGENSETQQAILTVWDWYSNGQVDRQSMPLSIERPSTIQVTESGTVLIKLLTESAPTMLFIRQYDQLLPSGLVAGEPLRSNVWMNPNIMSEHSHKHSQEHVLDMIFDEDPPGWQIELQIDNSREVIFITLFADWLEEGPGSYSANWLMSASS